MEVNFCTKLEFDVYPCTCKVGDTVWFDDENPDIKLGDLAPDGNQLRPHIVWFGEDVPNIGRAGDIVFGADALIIVGTSLVVYPAAGLVEYLHPDTKVYVVDPTRARRCCLFAATRYTTSENRRARESTMR